MVDLESEQTEIGSIDLDKIENSERKNLFRESNVQSNKLRLYGVPDNHSLFAKFSGHSSTIEHE